MRNLATRFRGVLLPVLAAVVIVGGAGDRALAQHLYIYNDIHVNESTGAVTVNASTSTDYNSAYYYDIGVQTVLDVLPEGGGSYATCQTWASSNSTYAAIAPCTVQLGSQNATLNLSSFHWLDATYYVYQLGYCTWDCYYFADWYGFSLLGPSPGNFNDNQFFFAPGQNTPVSQTTSKSAYKFRTKEKGGCFYPSSEMTYSWGWNAYWPYTGQFLQVLQGGAFNNRFVTEYFSGNAADGCWQPHNTVLPAENPQRGTWGVNYIGALDWTGASSSFQFTYNNGWGFDHLGFFGVVGLTRLSEYVDNMRSVSGACSVSFAQEMYMFCSGASGPGQYYRPVAPMHLVISATPSTASLSSSRDGVWLVRQYP